MIRAPLGWGLDAQTESIPARRSPMIARARALLDTPAVNVAIFAVLLNYPWEFLQIRFYAAAPDTVPWDMVEKCSLAALGDGMIMVVCYFILAVVTGSRWWVLSPRPRQLLGFIAAGVLITVAIEHIATRSGGSWGWRYSPLMPLLPLLEAGLAPVLQWILLPPLVIWFVRRQLSHCAAAQNKPDAE